MTHRGDSGKALALPMEVRVTTHATEFEFNQRRFKDLLLYVAEKLQGDPTFGETKLNKALFFADVEAYRLLGRPVTGAEYQRNYHGPTARLYTVMRDDLRNHGQLEVERRMVIDHEQDVVKPLVRPNMTQFSPQEISIIDAVIADLRSYTNTQISDRSHERSAGWRAKGQGETIPYEDWIIDPEPADPEAIAALRRAEGLPA
ncbi:MAG: Panacea domain-containing protein [Gaiellaceae bacterium]